MATHLGMRPRVDFPDRHRRFHLVRSHGRVFALPPWMDPEIALRSGQLFGHPDVLTAATLEELTEQLDALGDHPSTPEPLGELEGCQLFQLEGMVYAVPNAAGPVNLCDPEDRRRAGVVRGCSIAEVRDRLANLRERIPVEFAGWLPIYERSGNCGKHPQFGHTAEPPPGYRFTCSAPPQSQPRESLWDRTIGRVFSRIGQGCIKLGTMARPLFAVFRGAPHIGVLPRFRLLGTLLRLGFTLLRRGARPGAILRFLHSRHFQSQLLLAPHRGLVFLTSMPYTLSQNPWVIEIEDPTTLFYPLIQNGRTLDLDIKTSPYYPIVKALLESDQCRGIVTHIRSTARLVPTLFDSDIIRRKVFYTPLGVKVPARWQKHEEPRDGENDDIHLLFINSWCQVPENFYVRGGLDILEAFDQLRKRYPRLRLTLRTALPALDDHYHRILESGWVRIINRFMSSEEMAELHARSHIFLLPAARIHIVSLLQAMSYGLAVVASDGWGIEEYLEHERNGLVVKGRYGKTSWADESAGLLREDYEPMYTPDPTVVRGLVEGISRLIEDRLLRARLGRTARADVETRYTLEQWNQGLRAVFDHATRDDRKLVVPAGEETEPAPA